MDSSAVARMRLEKIRVSNPVFTEIEKPGNPEIFQNRKTGFSAARKPVFRFCVFGELRTFVISDYFQTMSLRQCTSPQRIRSCTLMCQFCCR
jgi:hypothetical protein